MNTQDKIMNFSFPIIIGIQLFVFNMEGIVVLPILLLQIFWIFYVKKQKKVVKDKKNGEKRK